MGMVHGDIAFTLIKIIAQRQFGSDQESTDRPDFVHGTDLPGTDLNQIVFVFS